MDETAAFLLTLGGILLLGFVTSQLGQRTFLPRVTLLILFGILIGPEIFDLVPTVFSDRFELATDMALLMVGFLLGGKLTRDTFADSSKKILCISLSASVFTAVCVTIAMSLFNVPIQIAILLGCISAATAPAAVLDVVIESKKKTPFKNLLLAIVGLDDVWALVLFAIGISVVTSLNGGGLETSFVLHIARELGGALMLGTLIGLPAAYLTGRAKLGQPLLTEAIGLIFVCGGLAMWMEVSFLIAAMVMGAMVANFAKHHEYYFHEIEGIEWPFMVVFFVLAGVTLEFDSVWTVGFIGLAYIASRSAGKIIGAFGGGVLSDADTQTKQWMGVALLPQAGVAIGMALVASNQFPEYRQILLTVVISSTVIFELIGPVLTRLAIEHSQN